MQVVTSALLVSDILIDVTHTGPHISQTRHFNHTRAALLVFISAKEVVFSPVSVCLSVCLSDC